MTSYFKEITIKKIKQKGGNKRNKERITENKKERHGKNPLMHTDAIFR